MNHAPANPYESEYRVEYRAAMREAGVLPADVQTEAVADPQPLPDHALALYPWLAKHAHTARIEMMIILNPRTQRYERGQVVTVTVYHG